MSGMSQRIQVSILVFVSLFASRGTLAAADRGDLDVEALKTAQQIFQDTHVKGGLVVQLGCGSGKLTAALHAGDRYLVHGLDSDAGNVQQARDYVTSLGLYGPVSIDRFGGRKLPYADNLVNLIVVTGDRWKVSDAEIVRVLAPGGIAVSLDAEHAVHGRFRKQWPDDIDEWTHSLHGADNNAVAQDTVVGPPRHFQWISEPRFSRSHDHLASVSAVVSSGGRVFSVIDMGSIAFAGASSRWQLVARDAFSGVRLWAREIPNWEYHLRDFRSGPADIARRLVAVGERVYVTLGYGQPVSILDAATGKTIRTCAGTEGTHEIVYDDGTLLLVVGKPDRQWGAQQAKQIVSQPGYSPPFEKDTPPAHDKQLLAVDAETGELIWKKSGPDTRDIMPSTLAAAVRRVYFQNLDTIVCLDASTGERHWTAKRSTQRRRLAWSTPTLVVHNGVVFSADRKAAQTDGPLLWMPSGGYHEYIRGEDVQGELIAFDAETGKRLWNCPSYESFNSPVDVLIAGGLLWTGRYAWGQDPGITEARDPKTGQVVRQRPADQTFMRGIGHARCHRAKATSKYLVLGRRGVECVDLKTGNMIANRWVRGICQYGVMPANGLLYVPPHSCACSVTDQLKCGFMALAPEGSRVKGRGSRAKEQLERGPGFGNAGSGVSTSEARSSDDWPTYRHDASRSGVTSVNLADGLTPAWTAKLGGRLTSPVIAEGVVLVAAPDSHRVYALDAETGRQLWSFVTGARIDSPPTIDRGRVLFGSADGRVCCLRLADGELIWRFRAWPEDRLIVVNEQLESAWPVTGSVLVVDGAAYFTAGRNSYLDGGMKLYKLEAATGQVLKVADLAVEKAKRDGGIASVGYLPDVLSTDGESIFLRSARFDRDLVRQKDDVPHLWSSVGFLDASWWHRTYWQIGTSMGSGWGAWPKAGQRVPSGRLLVTNGTRVFGFGRNQYDIPGAHVGVDGESAWGPVGKGLSRWTYYRLFGKSLSGQASQQRRRGETEPVADESDWSRRIPVLVQAMLVADKTLLVAGPADPVREIPHDPTGVDPLVDALNARQGGRLLAVSPADGETVSVYELASPPVFDGMAAARGRLYLATKSGAVVCMQPGSHK